MHGYNQTVHLNSMYLEKLLHIIYVIVGVLDKIIENN